MYRGLLPLLHCQKPGRFAPEAFKDFILKEETVASRTVLCLLRGWCCFRLGNRAFGLGILNMFCHYMLSSGGLVPMVQCWHQRFTWRQAAAFSGSDLNASELVVSSRVPKCLHRIGGFGPQNGGQKARRKTRPLPLASTVPCLHGAVELLLTGDQHKPCASFNQQACKNTTSVAEGKRKTPQKIASKGAKICKKSLRFGVQKWTRFGVSHYFFKTNKPPKRVHFWTPKRMLFLHIFAPFDAIFCGVFRLPSATDVVFLHAC